MKTSKVLLLALLASIPVSVATVFLVQQKQKKIVVVDAIKLFNGFGMKVEMENKAAVVLKQIRRKCDSLGNMINVIEQSGHSADELLVNEFRNARAAFEQEYEASNNEINQQVWKRLNPLIAEFGRESHFAVVIGANGMGSVLYNDGSCDVTEEAIKYVNKMYENKK